MTHNNKIIILPLYIQIKIIEIISNLINKYKIITFDNNIYKDELDWFLSTYSVYKQHNDLLILNIALVSWSWFKIISPLILIKYLNLYKSYINTSSFNQYSIIKFNNITSLFININDINSYKIEIIKSYIRNMKCLKEIIINSSINNLNNFILDIPFNNIIISNIEINKSFNKLPFNLTKIKLITITQQPLDKSILLELFKKVDFIQLVINSNSIYLNSILKQLKNNNYTIFKSVKRIIFNYFQPLETINNIILLSPNLKHFSIKLCYKNLIYCLSDNERNESSICSCTNNNSGSGSFEDFIKQWKCFSSLISDNTTLKSFQLSNHCPFQSSNISFNDQKNFTRLPNSFIENFSKVFIKNKSIRKLALYDFQTQVHDFIIMNNTNLTYYKSLFK